MTACMHAGGRDKAAPSTCTCSYAAPEMLLALQLADLFHCKTKKINGVAADMWAAGCTLYCMLTGKLPFNMDDTGRFKRRWEKFRAAHRVQESWVSPQRDLVHMPPTSPCCEAQHSLFNVLLVSLCGSEDLLEEYCPTCTAHTMNINYNYPVFLYVCINSR